MSYDDAVDSRAADLSRMAAAELFGGALEPFRLERYFARFEFADDPHLLCCSDARPLPMRELLELADDDGRERWEALSLCYTESAGAPALREEIARYYGGCVKVEHTLCCVPQEGVLLMHALLKPGQHVVVSAPGYQSLYGVAKAMGCLVTPWLPTRSATGQLRFEVSRLRELVQPGTAMVVTNFPHNPTGCVLSRDELAEVVAIARGAGAFVFSDEMYRTNETDCPSVVELCDRSISLGGLSKTHGCPGLRCGWLVTRDAALRARLVACKDFTTICGSAPSEALAVIALRATSSIVGRNKAMIAANLVLLNAFFERHKATWEWPVPQAGTVGFPRLLTGESADSFCERLRTACNVLLLPSSVYDYTVPGEERVRIGYGRADMAAVLQKLEDFLAAEPKRH